MIYYQHGLIQNCIYFYIIIIINSEVPNIDIVQDIIKNYNNNKGIIDLTGVVLSFTDIDYIFELLSSGVLGAIDNIYLRNTGLTELSAKYVLSKLNECLLDRLNVVDLSYNHIGDISTEIISVLLDMSGCIQSAYCRDVGVTEKSVVLLQSLSIDKLWPTHLHLERIFIIIIYLENKISFQLWCNLMACQFSFNYPIYIHLSSLPTISPDLQHIDLSSIYIII